MQRWGYLDPGVGCEQTYLGICTQIHVTFYIYNRWWAHKSQDNWQFLPIFCHCSSVLFRQHVDDDVSVHMEELPCSISICGGSSFTCLIRDIPLFSYLFINFGLRNAFVALWRLWGLSEQSYTWHRRWTHTFIKLSNDRRMPCRTCTNFTCGNPRKITGF